jgi:hypothetical protein
VSRYFALLRSRMRFRVTRQICERFSNNCLQLRDVKEWKFLD